MELSTAIGIAAGSLTAVSALPQVFKVLKDKKATDVSPLMFAVLMAGNAAWVWYGILLEEWPIIITNAFSFCVDCTMIVLNFKYSGKK
jgi:MtN3 and saliva related transmembrane protein